MAYTIILADGRQLTDLGMNGTNFISAEPVDESIFEENLDTVTISDGETEQIYHNVEFVQQQKWPDGWYLAFRQKSQQELEMEAIRKAIAESAGAQDAVWAAIAEAYREGVQQA